LNARRGEHGRTHGCPGHDRPPQPTTWPTIEAVSIPKHRAPRDRESYEDRERRSHELSTGGLASALEHNLGDTQSPFTSWTTNPEVARGFAGRNGVVLRIPYGPGDGYGIVGSPDLFGESEVLIEGIVRGAVVLR
jgi:hypothetical protein